MKHCQTEKLFLENVTNLRFVQSGASLRHVNQRDQGSGSGTKSFCLVMLRRKRVGGGHGTSSWKTMSMSYWENDDHVSLGKPPDFIGPQEKGLPFPSKFVGPYKKGIDYFHQN